VKVLTGAMICLFLVFLASVVIACAGAGDASDVYYHKSSPESTVRGFLQALLSGDINEIEKHLVTQGAGMPTEIREAYVLFNEALMVDISFSVSNILVEELWATDSEVAVKAKYDLEGEVNGRNVTVPDEDTFLLEKRDGEWLISQWDEVEQSPPILPITPIPSLTPDPVTTGTPFLTCTPLPDDPGETLLSDDFSRPSGMWPVYSDRHGIAYYKDEALRVKHRGFLRRPEICVARCSFDDFVLHLDTKLVEGGEDSWIIVACRTDYWGNGYHFLVSADGRYAIAAQRKAGEREFLQEPVLSEHVNNGNNETNQLRLECVDNSISFSVNGNLLVEMLDNTFISGALGLGISTSTETGNAEAMFDNVLITSPAN